MNTEEKKESIVKRIRELSVLLGGTMTELIKSDSSGRSSKLIHIEYEINQKDEGI